MRLEDSLLPSNFVLATARITRRILQLGEGCPCIYAKVIYFFLSKSDLGTVPVGSRKAQDGAPVSIWLRCTTAVALNKVG